ncbi:MAG: hypothetical protein Q8P24_16580, partial [Desulfobacterales bacterium]|nr:hypothetical protein [Desulfobacterales bacterium]
GSEITNSKHQITKKPQIPILNDPNLPGRDIIWIFEFWSLEIYMKIPFSYFVVPASGMGVVWYL